MAVLVLFLMAIASFGSVLLGIAAFPPRNSAFALVFFFLIPVASLIGFGGAIRLMGGMRSRQQWNPVRALFLAFCLSFPLGAGLSLMTRL